ncbi:MAG TPA: hypothetical protein VK804_15465 [Bradyrhizobium sp.]|uniref:hypothetical protein n=1 Tax=Bradyrhizobium sp. TaxID=376 RepID=UPI002B67F1F0|nr:hypothetical protein [Bradyrhizobium sp.]HTB01866.1 hypothetical protein [Bradyrhizobium sp.]
MDKTNVSIHARHREDAFWSPCEPIFGEIAVNKLLLVSIAFASVAAAAPSYGQQRSDADVLPLLRASTLENLTFAQFRGYSASGTHQCGSEKGRSCVVTGSGFTNCNDASITLQTRDCCPTTPVGGKSSGFTLNYCITDRPL